jgi:hypothetical protein
VTVSVGWEPCQGAIMRISLVLLLKFVPSSLNLSESANMSEWMIVDASILYLFSMENMLENRKRDG